MQRLSRDQFSAWEDLDALVGAELDALDRRKPEQRDAREQAPAFDAPDFAEEAFADEPFHDEPFDEEGNDEESFIERTAAWLRDRPDADALLDAIRAALEDVAQTPAPEVAPDVAAGGNAPSDGIAGEQ